MTLEQFSLSASPINTFINTLLIPQLISIVDNNNQQLNQSVSSCNDVILSSFINSKPAQYQCPQIFVSYDPAQYTIQNQSNVVLYNKLPITLYCVFSLDYPSPSFIELRDAYIRTIFHWLKYNDFGDGIGFKHYPYWAWTSDDAVVTHNSTIEFLGKQYPITPVSDYNVSKIVLNVIMKNYVNPLEYNALN